MTEFFLKMLNMSISASWIILGVLLLRFCFKKVSKWISCLLWGIVAMRLIMPFSFESAWSLIPSTEVIPQDIAASQTPAIHSAIPVVDGAVNPLFTLHLTQNESLLDQMLAIAAVVWIAGVAILLLYSAITSLRLRWQTRASILIQDDVYVCDAVESPFVFGVFHPRIYLPSNIDVSQLPYVLAHERAHIQRKDHWWKPLGFLLLTVYWLNPLMWLAYILLCRDIEQACDEKVIADMDTEGKKGYSIALLACSVHRRSVMICPVAFGEVGVKTRIKGVLSYKKPAFWIILISVILSGVAAVCFLTDPIPCKHDYQSELTISPTCTKTGMETHTCTLCEHSYTASVDMVAHVYDAGVVSLEPTCVATGIKVYTCTGCGLEQTETLEITAHIAGEPTFLKEPNCTETGERSATCTYCQAVFVTEILQTNDDHALTETVLKVATCAAPGEGALHCTRCDYTESCTYEQLEHTLETRTLQEATCRRNGIQVIECLECSYSCTVDLGFGDHEWEYHTSQKDKCSHCGWTRIRSSVLFDTSTDPDMPEDLYPVISIWP